MNLIVGCPSSISRFFGKAILGLIQAFSINWIYFEIDGDGLYVHAIRRSIYTSLLWVSVHLPFIMSFVLSSAALSRLVIAHDCRDASVEDLVDVYAANSLEQIDVGLRWYYCVGMGVALASMSMFPTAMMLATS